MYACVCACVYACVCACVHVCMCVDICTHNFVAKIPLSWQCNIIAKMSYAIIGVKLHMASVH